MRLRYPMKAAAITNKMVSVYMLNPATTPTRACGSMLNRRTALCGRSAPDLSTGSPQANLQHVQSWPLWWPKRSAVFSVSQTAARYCRHLLMDGCGADKNCSAASEKMSSR